MSRPSVLALTVAVATCSAILTAFCIYLTEDVIAGPMHRYLMQNPFERSLLVTSKALSSRRAARPDIVILGNSLTVFCIEGEEKLGEIMARGMGDRGLTIYNLSAEGQNVWDMLALVEMLDVSSSPLVIIGVSPSLLTAGIGALAESVETKTAISSPTLDREARSVELQVPRRRGVYFLDNWRFLLARRAFIIRNVLFTGAQPYADPLENIYEIKYVNRPEYWREEISKLPAVNRGFEANRDLNLTAVKKLVEELKKRADVSFILLEAPIHPGWYDEAGGKEFFDRYRKVLRDFAAHHGMSYVSVTDDAQFVAADFIDYEGHLGTREGRERCTGAVAAGAVKAVAQQQGTGHQTRKGEKEGRAPNL